MPPSDTRGLVMLVRLLVLVVLVTSCVQVVGCLPTGLCPISAPRSLLGSFVPAIVCFLVCFFFLGTLSTSPRFVTTVLDDDIALSTACRTTFDKTSQRTAHFPHLQLYHRDKTHETRRYPTTVICTARATASITQLYTRMRASIREPSCANHTIRFPIRPPKPTDHSHDTNTNSIANSQAHSDIRKTLKPSFNPQTNHCVPLPVPPRDRETRCFNKTSHIPRSLTDSMSMESAYKHCEYHWLAAWQVDPDTQQVGPDHP